MIYFALAHKNKIDSQRRNLHAKCCGDGSSRVLNSGSVTTTGGGAFPSGNNTEDPASRQHPLRQPRVLLLSQPRDNGDQSERALSHQSSTLFTCSAASVCPGGGVWAVGECRGGLATSTSSPRQSPSPPAAWSHPEPSVQKREWQLWSQGLKHPSG